MICFTASGCILDSWNGGCVCGVVSVVVFIVVVARCCFDGRGVMIARASFLDRKSVV